MLSLTPPTGHRLYFKDLFFNEGDSPFKGHLFNSGTSALYFLIKNLDIPVQSKILIPAYSCPTVAAAVLHAGHFPVLADINLDNFGYDQESLNQIVETKSINGIVKVNLFGLSSPEINTSLPVIEDNAQSNPITQKPNNSAGSIYSFGRGKPINSLGGGFAQISDTSKFRELDKNYNSIVSGNDNKSFEYLIKFFAYKFFYHPFLYKVLITVPQLHLGETIFDPDFKISKMNDINLKVIQNIVQRIDKIDAMRQKICKAYDRVLKIFKEQFMFYPGNLFYRYPVILKSAKMRGQFIKAFQEAGIGAFPLYPVPLNRQPGLAEILKDRGDYKNAEYISQNLFTLPVNEFINEKQIDKIYKVLLNHCK